jgi:hypothetical protein
MLLSSSSSSGTLQNVLFAFFRHSCVGKWQHILYTSAILDTAAIAVSSMEQKAAVTLIQQVFSF